jgi:hypothetical protein
MGIDCSVLATPECVETLLTPTLDAAEYIRNLERLGIMATGAENFDVLLQYVPAIIQTLHTHPDARATGIIVLSNLSRFVTEKNESAFNDVVEGVVIEGLRDVDVTPGTLLACCTLLCNLSKLGGVSAGMNACVEPLATALITHPPVDAFQLHVTCTSAMWFFHEVVKGKHVTPVDPAYEAIMSTAVYFWRLLLASDTTTFADVGLCARLAVDGLRTYGVCGESAPTIVELLRKSWVTYRPVLHTCIYGLFNLLYITSAMDPVGIPEFTADIVAELLSADDVVCTSQLMELLSKLIQKFHFDALLPVRGHT